MFRIAASWRVTFSAKLAGSDSYSSRARLTQRSMLAALFNNTSSAIHPPVSLDIPQQGLPRPIQLQLLAEHGALEQPHLLACSPPTLALHQHLLLHHRRSSAQIQQVDRATSDIGGSPGKPPEHQRIGIALHHHCQIEVTALPRRTLHTATEGINSQQPV